jgi:hypothetical protein
LVLSAVFSSIIDDFFLMSFSFLILGFASVELSIGLILLVFLKTLNLSLNLNQNKSFNYFSSFFLKKNSLKKRI